MKNPFSDMLEKTLSSPYYNRMLRFAKPLHDHFGINHFWYYRITFSGAYFYLGTHAGWNEYCFEHSLINHFPCLRHPNVLKGGMSLMRAAKHDLNYQNVQQIAWEKFGINFHLNLFEPLSNGIEAFGFASKFNDSKADERLINESSLLRYFTKVFRQKHEKLFHLMEDNQVDISSQIGPSFFERPQEVALPFDRKSFLEKIGCASLSSLTSREKDILKYLANGYPASYIKDKLHLGIRTVENYIATIKQKLYCSSKVELIKKAEELAVIGFLDVKE